MIIAVMLQIRSSIYEMFHYITEVYKFSKNLLLLPFHTHPERQECPVSACYVRITTEEIRNVVVIEELNCA